MEERQLLFNNIISRFSQFHFVCKLNRLMKDLIASMKFFGPVVTANKMLKLFHKVNFYFKEQLDCSGD